MSEHLDHVIRANKGKRWAIKVSHARNSIPTICKTNDQTRPNIPVIWIDANHTPRKSIFTLRPKACLKRVASSSDLSRRDLYNLYANGICSTLSLDSRPTYSPSWYVAQGVKVRSMFGNEGITLCSIPASARAVYAPRENPFGKMYQIM